MNIIGQKYIFLSISGVLVLASVASLSIWGLKLGIDFTGGSILEAEFLDSRPASQHIQKSLSGLEIGNVLVQPTGERGVILRFREVDEKVHQQILEKLSGERPGVLAEKRFDTIGPTIGKELKQKSFVAISLTLVFIVLYIAWAFRQVSRPVSSWKYGVAAIIALLHDVAIPTGIFSILGRFTGVEIDTLFVTALLTILGFSVHDTIVVFDRIRENLENKAKDKPFDAVVNQSVNETIARSINTSFTVILVLSAIMAFGGDTTFYFALMLALGVFFGTYSSIFIASPLLVLWSRYTNR